MAKGKVAKPLFQVVGVKPLLGKVKVGEHYWVYKESGDSYVVEIRKTKKKQPYSQKVWIAKGFFEIVEE